jgi:hypothetical protein
MQTGDSGEEGNYLHFFSIELKLIEDLVRFNPVFELELDLQIKNIE